MNADPLNQTVLVTAVPPQEEALRLVEQRDAAVYVARRAQGDADRDLLMDILGLVTPAGAVALALASTVLIAAGRRIQTGGIR